MTEAPLTPDELMQVRLGWARGGPVDRSEPRLRWMHALFGRLLATAVAWEDHPEFDGTDGAHPAWWRGSDHTVAALRPFLWHRYDCKAGGCAEPDDNKCSCGLSALA